MTTDITLGIAGTGVVGTTVARALDRGMPGFRLAGVAASGPDRVTELNATLGTPVEDMSFAELARHCDWVLEALPPALFADLARPVIEAGKTLVVLSCSQLLEHEALIGQARDTGATILVPSGAILGLDALRAAAEGILHSVTVETRKPPAGLAKAPYVVEQGLDLAGLTEPLCILKGSVREVARHFPANVNVAAATALAGMGPDATQMEIWADPEMTRNRHTVRVTSDSSDFTVSIEGRPSPQNPATGLLTAQSVLALLRRESMTLRVGT
jgi:aspartate dehydrogenase